jgi:hypothetical protein
MERNPLFKILIAYETFSSGVRAREMSERLAARLQSEFEMSSDIWKFELLNHPQLREQAATEAAEADMVIMAARRAADLPAHIRDWIESWLPQRKEGSAAALVALLDEPEEEESRAETPPLGAYLRRVAEEGHMDFFCQVGGGREQDFDDTVETIHRRAERRAGGLNALHAVSSGQREWDINE